jgi:hypothetical protein
MLGTSSFVLTISSHGVHISNVIDSNMRSINEKRSPSYNRRISPIISSSEKYKDWKIKSTSSVNNKSAGLECQRAAKLSSLISNRQTKAASDVVQVDFHTDATCSNRIPTYPYIGRQ